MEDDTSAVPSAHVTTPGLLWVFGEFGYESITVWVDGGDFDLLTPDDLKRERQARNLFPESEVAIFHAWARGAKVSFWGQRDSEDQP